MQIPPLIERENLEQATDLLRCYYSLGEHADHGAFTGARYDDWNTTAHPAHPNRFTSDDLVAVSLLSVDVPGAAAVRLLETEAHIFSSLLWELGPDRDLVTETEPWADDWVGWRLWAALVDLPGVGPTTASKLYARKRPRLRPIYDSVVEAAVGNKLWGPLRAELHDSPWLHPHLISLRTSAQLPESISALRIFDVVVWMSAQPPCPLARPDRPAPTSRGARGHRPGSR